MRKRIKKDMILILFGIAIVAVPLSSAAEGAGEK